MSLSTLPPAELHALLMKTAEQIKRAPTGDVPAAHWFVWRMGSGKVRFLMSFDTGIALLTLFKSIQVVEGYSAREFTLRDLSEGDVTLEPFDDQMVLDLKMSRLLNTTVNGLQLARMHAKEAELSDLIKRKSPSKSSASPKSSDSSDSSDSADSSDA